MTGDFPFLVRCSLLNKLGVLQEILQEMGSLVVAYSGGVDSAFLTRMAADVLGERVLAVTAVSPSLSRQELEASRHLARSLGVRYREITSREMENEAYCRNPHNRCYYCKQELFGLLGRLAREEGYAYVADGTNADDWQDFRPGQQAGREHGVRSPLAEAELTKKEIRQFSRALGLPTWNKPPAACLASRIPYGERITAEKLHQVEQAETVLERLEFSGLRVRHHGPVARVELPVAALPRAVQPEVRQQIVDGLKKCGFSFVCLDLEGYRTGSLNWEVGSAR